MLARGSDPHLRVNWVAGKLSVRTLATTRLAETWIHTMDVAEALDVASTPADRLRFVAVTRVAHAPRTCSSVGKRTPRSGRVRAHWPTGDAWDFQPEDTPATVIRGDGVELCLVAACAVGTPATLASTGEGPDAGAVLQLVRTYA